MESCTRSRFDLATALLLGLAGVIEHRLSLSLPRYTVADETAEVVLMPDRLEYIIYREGHLSTVAGDQAAMLPRRLEGT